MSLARNPFLRLTTLLGALFLLSGAALWAARGGGTAPAPSSSVGSLAGRDTAAGGKRLPEMVVYLEPTDPSKTFTVSKEPVAMSQRDAKFLRR